ncbi:tannase and feruloyl esterase [Pochonia chlamydosporia 170]|uniref:Carboxylic ester hydrolase n=1 Tax=Pochonia chlamydosporia 170 TaxID=1380566 RepID=A0A179FLJ5_METCM|nr:tannase and feruloyl esterase [Pochonia chlamydosporia 170]OAQ65869.2 tannase and feruloyl esterase [Pochonia chlamydosporia 170]
MSNLAAACTPSTFTSGINVFGTQLLNIEAHLITNYSRSVPNLYRPVHPSVEVQNVSFCNVTLSYTHTGQHDEVFLETWLPIGNWNGMFQGIGGSGWAAGRVDVSSGGMAGAVGDGFATSSTDGGTKGLDAAAWVLKSPGNVDLVALQDWSAVSLGEQATISKSLIKSFYGKNPKYSYWMGCSQGGRQGIMLAQRYPDAYDGIAACDPAMYLTNILPNIFWPYQAMVNAGSFPHMCEFDSITAAAIAACDELDGVKDGVVSNPMKCLDTFDPFKVVGQTLNCSNSKDGSGIKVSREAAQVVKATWRGLARKDGEVLWPGVSPAADLTGNKPSSLGLPGVLLTQCKDGKCSGAPYGLGGDWLQYFVAKDPNKDISHLSQTEFDALVNLGEQEYGSFIDASYADLSAFRAAGGKMIVMQGLDDELVPFRSTEHYYNSVSKVVPHTHDFYRLFEVPGLSHCVGGQSQQPVRLFAQLREWVEKGTAPAWSPVKLNVTGGHVHDRIICPYPQTARLSACRDPAL